MTTEKEAAKGKSVPRNHMAPTNPIAVRYHEQLKELRQQGEFPPGFDHDTDGLRACSTCGEQMRFTGFSSTWFPDPDHGMCYRIQACDECGKCVREEAPPDSPEVKRNFINDIYRGVITDTFPKSTTPDGSDGHMRIVHLY